MQPYNYTFTLFYFNWTLFSLAEWEQNDRLAISCFLITANPLSAVFVREYSPSKNETSFSLYWNCTRVRGQVTGSTTWKLINTHVPSILIYLHTNTFSTSQFQTTIYKRNKRCLLLYRRGVRETQCQQVFIPLNLLSSEKKIEWKCCSFTKINIPRLEETVVIRWIYPKWAKLWYIHVFQTNFSSRIKDVQRRIQNSSDEKVAPIN